MVEAGVIGGAIFFRDNLPSPYAAMDLTQAFREAAGTHALQLGVRNCGIDHDDSACARAECHQRVKCGAFSTASRRLDNDVATGAYALL